MFTFATFMESNRLVNFWEHFLIKNFSSSDSKRTGVYSWFTQSFDMEAFYRTAKAFALRVVCFLDFNSKFKVSIGALIGGLKKLPTKNIQSVKSLLYFGKCH